MEKIFLELSSSLTGYAKDGGKNHCCQAVLFPGINILIYNLRLMKKTMYIMNHDFPNILTKNDLCLKTSSKKL